MTMNTYSGTLRRRLQTLHLSVGEYSYPGRYRIARHVHDLPFISLLLDGRYRERVGAAVMIIACHAIRAARNQRRRRMRIANIAPAAMRNARAIHGASVECRQWRSLLTGKRPSHPRTQKKEYPANPSSRADAAQ